jgi:hypothetical protein
MCAIPNIIICGDPILYIYLTLHCLLEVLSVRNGKGANVRNAKYHNMWRSYTVHIFNPALPI